MNRLKRILVVTAVVPLVCFGLFGPTPGGAYDSAGINMQVYTVGKDAVEPVYLLGEENITLLLVIRNETGKPVVTERGFSEVELDDALVVQDPNGIRHLLREVGDAHFMRDAVFLERQAVGQSRIASPGLGQIGRNSGSARKTAGHEDPRGLVHHQGAAAVRALCGHRSGCGAGIPGAARSPQQLVRNAAVQHPADIRRTQPGRQDRRHGIRNGERGGATAGARCR